MIINHHSMEIAVDIIREMIFVMGMVINLEEMAVVVSIEPIIMTILVIAVVIAR